MNNKCMYCGAEIEIGSLYCNHCGKKQTKTYTAHFDARFNNSSNGIIAEINDWLYNNPCLANVRCKVSTRHGLGLLANKYVIEYVDFTYELFDAPNTYGYIFEEVSSTTLFSGIGVSSTEQLIEKWRMNHPGCIIIDSFGGTHSRGRNPLFDIGNQKKSQVFLLYKVKRE